MTREARTLGRAQAMTNKRIARGYFQEAEGRLRYLDVLLLDKRFATVVREAQEVVELLLKAALRFGPSFYGDEARGIPPDELFHEEDARTALERARFVFGCCQRLLEN